MRNFLTNKEKEKQVQEDPESIFYYESYLDHYEKGHTDSRFSRISPLFLFLFILPAIFIFLLKTIPSTGIYFKIGLVLFLEISTWIMDLWICRALRNKNIILLWLIEIPLVLLIFFSLYLTF